MFLDTMTDQDGDGDEEIIIGAKGANETMEESMSFLGCIAMVWILRKR